jgi:hypothetical protein
MSTMNKSSHLKFKYDFVIYDDRGHLAAVLEAKRRFGTDPQWARAWHQTLVENKDQPAGVSVALVTPELIYAWRPEAGASAAPDWVLDAAPQLGPYFTRLRIPVGEVHPHVFEQIVGMWLRDVVQREPPDAADTAGGGGLLDLLRGGHVVEQEAA